MRVLSVLLLLSFFCRGQTTPLPAPGTGIERTLTALAQSTAERPNTVRVLFYGQSITKQSWWRTVAEHLRERYPHAHIILENHAIGGYSTPRLIRTMEADILPFHPDLILFHDYGQQDRYEQIIRWIRENTTADILLQSDHILWQPGEPDPDGAKQRTNNFSERHSYQFLPELAARHGLGLVDIRGAFRRHLAAHNLPSSALLSDGVHLNAEGEKVYAAATIAYLNAIPDSLPPYWTAHNPPGGVNQVTIAFNGNRLDLIDYSGPALDVTIDGQRPAQFDGLYYHSRPTNTWDADWPTVMHVGHEAPLETEEWTLKVTRVARQGAEFDFELYGSRTGPDGAGSNTKPFRSRSGRVTLQPSDYDVERSIGLHKIAMPYDWQIRWSTLPRFRDPVLPASGAQTILYGLPPGPHAVVLTAPPGQRLPPLRLRSYAPPLVVK